MKVIEHYLTIEGEGPAQGYPTVVIRAAGCNLRCVWCDSKFTHDPDQGEEMTPEDISDFVRVQRTTRALITGGEPLLQEDLVQVITELLGNDIEVFVETNGSHELPRPFPFEDRLHWIMDYKLPSSNQEGDMDRSNIKRLRQKDALKFVVASVGDLLYAFSILDLYEPYCQIFFSPVASYEPEGKLAIIAESLLKHRDRRWFHQCRVQIQLHRLIWGDERGR